MSSLLIKIIACLTMLCDHLGYELAAYGAAGTQTTDIMRIIGRVSFPLFAFMLAEGFKKSHNVTLYFIRVLLVAFISEIPFDLCFYGNWYVTNHQNVMFTLAIGLFALIFVDMCSNSKRKGVQAFCLLPIAGACFLADYLSVDYGYFAILLICMFYFLDNGSYKGRILYLPVITLFAARKVVYSCLTGSPITSWGLTQLYEIISFVPILLYNGNRGYTPKSKSGKALFKWSFYMFYPVHILALYLAFSDHSALLELISKISEVFK